MPLVYTTKDSVLDELETALLTIDGIEDVDRKHVGIEEYVGYKGCFLADVREGRKTVLKDCILVSYTTQIVVWVQVENESEDVDLNALLNSAIEEIKNVVLNYFTLSNTVCKTIIESVDTDMGFEWPTAYGTFTLEITFLSEV